MANKFNIRMITPDGKSYKDEAELLNVVTSSGSLGIMAKHLPLVAILEISHLTYKINNEIREFAISGGIINVGKEETLLLVESFESKEEIDINRALDSKSRAETRLSLHDENIDIKRAEVALKRALNRLSVAKYSK